MAKATSSDDKSDESCTLKRLWSFAAILNRVGLSESLIGKKKYDEIVVLANKGVDGKQRKCQFVYASLKVFIFV